MGAIYAAVIAATIAAAVSFAQLISTKIDNKKTLGLQEHLAYESIEANVISKARIEWIQEARKAATNFMSDCSEYLLIMTTFQTNYSDNSDAREKLKILEINLIKSANLLILYFGNDFGENDAIVNQITNLNEKILKEPDTWPYADLIRFDFMKFNTDIESLRDVLRKYFKKEWLKVSKVKGADEESKTIRKIQEIKEFILEQNCSLKDYKEIASNIEFRKRFHENWISINKNTLDNNKKMLMKIKILAILIIIEIIVSIILLSIHKYLCLVFALFVTILSCFFFAYFLFKYIHLINHKRFRNRIELVKELDIILNFVNNAIQTLEKPKTDK